MSINSLELLTFLLPPQIQLLMAAGYLAQKYFLKREKITFADALSLGVGSIPLARAARLLANRINLGKVKTVMDREGPLIKSIIYNKYLKVPEEALLKSVKNLNNTPESMTKFFQAIDEYDKSVSNLLTDKRIREQVAKQCPQFAKLNPREQELLLDNLIRKEVDDSLNRVIAEVNSKNIDQNLKKRVIKRLEKSKARIQKKKKAKKPKNCFMRQSNQKRRNVTHQPGVREEAVTSSKMNSSVDPRTTDKKPHDPVQDKRVERNSLNVDLGQPKKKTENHASFLVRGTSEEGKESPFGKIYV